MNDCTRIREMLPWYARRTLPAKDAQAVAEHLTHCAECRELLAEDVRLSLEIESALAAEPGLPVEAWKRVAERTHGVSVTNVDIGSFLLGFSVAAKMKQGRFPVRGDLRLMGKKIRLFDVGEEE